MASKIKKQGNVWVLKDSQGNVIAQSGDKKTLEKLKRLSGN